MQNSYLEDQVGGRLVWLPFSNTDRCNAQDEEEEDREEDPEEDPELEPRLAGGVWRGAIKNAASELMD